MEHMYTAGLSLPVVEASLRYGIEDKPALVFAEMVEEKPCAWATVSLRAHLVRSYRSLYDAYLDDCLSNGEILVDIYHVRGLDTIQLKSADKPGYYTGTVHMPVCHASAVLRAMSPERQLGCISQPFSLELDEIHIP